MNNDEKILKALETLQDGQTRLEKTVTTLQATVSTLQADVSDVKQGTATANERLGRLEDGQAHTSTALDALKAGQDDLRDHMKASFMDLGAKIDRTARDNKRLIEELEEQANITNPHKN